MVQNDVSEPRMTPLTSLSALQIKYYEIPPRTRYETKSATNNLYSIKL